MATVSVGAATNVAADAITPVKCREFTSAKVLVVYNKNVANDIRAKIADVSGTTVSFLGAEATIDTSTPRDVSLTQLDSTRILCVYADVGPDCRAMVVQRSGDTVTTNITYQLNQTNVSTVDATLIDTDKVLVVFSDNASSNIGRAVVLTISGTVVTVNATFSFHTGTAARNCRADVISTTRVLVCYANVGNSERATAQVLDISGTTITGNTEYQLHTDDAFGSNNEHTIDCQVWSTTKAYVMIWSTTAGTGRGFLLGLSGTVISVDDALNTPPVANNGLELIKVDASNVLAHFGGPFTVVRHNLVSFTGTSLTMEAFGDTDSSAGGGSLGICQLDASNYLCVFIDSSSLEDEARVLTISGLISFALAPMTRPVDIDADGSNLYLALLNGGNPALIKMATSLDADGSIVFAPGSGDNIGVQCGRFDADAVWVAGAFDGTNTVEKSEDGGTVFTVKDPATFGDVEAFVVGPDSDIRVLIADDNINVQQTLDDGETWTAINTGTGFNVNAIARLPQNVQESVFGNDAGAVDNVDYSANSGADMEDFSTGFPTEDATRVIVN